MPKHKPRKDQSCADADRLADEQIAALQAEIARLNAQLYTWRSHVCPTQSTTYPTIIRQSSSVAPLYTTN